MISQQRYQEIVTLCQNLMAATEAKPVYGGDYDEALAGTIVYHSTTVTSDGDKVMINLTEEHARPPFEWLVEISTWGQLAVHVLVYPDGRIVEAYGQRLFDMSDDNVRQLTDFIRRTHTHADTTSAK